MSLPRVFTASNSLGASVYEVESQRELDYVLSVDIDAGEVVRCHQPVRVIGDEVAKYTERYRAIHPIYGESAWPQLFHCYGRLA